MFKITIDVPRWSAVRTFTTDDPFAWLDRAYGIAPDLIVLSVDSSGR